MGVDAGVGKRKGVCEPPVDKLLLSQPSKESNVATGPTGIPYVALPCIALAIGQFHRLMEKPTQATCVETKS